MSNDPDDKYLIKGPQIDDPEPANPNIQPPARVQIRKGFDEQGRPMLSALTTLSETPEEHIYLVYRSPVRDAVVECDLLGDQAVMNSDGKLPPVIHIECPRCSKPDPAGTRPENSKRSILSITYGNKHFEIEDLDQKDWGVVTLPDGRPVMGSKGQPAIVSRRLTIKESFKCSYCGRRFKITDNFMQDA